MTNREFNLSHLTSQEVEQLCELEKISLIDDCDASISTDAFGNTVVEFQDLTKFFAVVKNNETLLNKLQPARFDEEEDEDDFAIEGHFKKTDATLREPKLNITEKNPLEVETKPSMQETVEKINRDAHLGSQKSSRVLDFFFDKPESPLCEEQACALLDTIQETADKTYPGTKGLVIFVLAYVAYKCKVLHIYVLVIRPVIQKMGRGLVCFWIYNKDSFVTWQRSKAIAFEFKQSLSREHLAIVQRKERRLLLKRSSRLFLALLAGLIVALFSAEASHSAGLPTSTYQQPVPLSSAVIQQRHDIACHHSTGQPMVVTPFIKSDFSGHNITNRLAIPVRYS